MLRWALLCAMLCGCATGSVVDPETLNPPVVQVPQKPAPVEDAGIENDGVKCILIQSVYGGNCRLDEYQCDDGSYRLDGKCYPPDWIPPWKNRPDPPFHTHQSTE